MPGLPSQEATGTDQSAFAARCGFASGLPEKVAQRVPQLFPKDTLVPDRVVGVDQIMAEAIQNKFIAAPLNADQVKELIQLLPNP